jgi:hypothetical protein
MECGRLTKQRCRPTNMNSTVLEYAIGITCGITINFMARTIARAYRHMIATFLFEGVCSAKKEKPLSVEVACVHSIFGVFREKTFKFLVLV